MIFYPSAALASSLTNHPTPSARPFGQNADQE